jgi:hypothetical protein
MRIFTNGTKAGQGHEGESLNRRGCGGRKEKIYSALATDEHRRKAEKNKDALMQVGVVPAKHGITSGCAGSCLRRARAWATES